MLNIDKDTERSDPRIVKRHWWIALPISLISGIGYLYVGHPKRFLAYNIFSLLALAALYFDPFGLTTNPTFVFTLLALAFVILAVVIIDTTRLAVTQKSYRLRWYNRWWLYLVSLAVVIGLSFLPDVIGPSAPAIRNFSVPSSSNLPTLRVDETFIVDNRSYATTDPKRGDMAIFKLPRDNETDFIKRIVGLPGDKIQMIAGVLHVNGEPVKRERIADFLTADSGCIFSEEKKAFEIPRYAETLPNGVRYETLDCKANTQGDDTDVFEVPDGHYFVMGDNRDNSADSRFPHVVGFVPRENIYAKAAFVLYSPDFDRIGLRLK